MQYRDSHIYLYRDGTLEQLNIDHNFGAQLDQMALEGSITQDEALHHPQRAALTSYLGISELTLISGNRMPFQLRKEMCSFNARTGCTAICRTALCAEFWP